MKIFSNLKPQTFKLDLQSTLSILVAAITLSISASVYWIYSIRIGLEEDQKSANALFAKAALSAETLASSFLSTEFVLTSISNNIENGRSTSRLTSEIIKDISDLTFRTKSKLKHFVILPESSARKGTYQAVEQSLQNNLKRVEDLINPKGVNPFPVAEITIAVKNLHKSISRLNRLNTIEHSRILQRVRDNRNQQYKYFLSAMGFFILIGGYLFWVLLAYIKKLMKKNIKSEAYIRSLMNSTAQAIYSTNLCGQITFCNNTCRNLLGYKTESDLIGKSESVFKMDLSKFNQSHTDSHTSESTQMNLVSTGLNSEKEVRTRFKKADGSPLDVEYWSYPILDISSQPTGKVIAFFDITKKIEDEKQLKEYQDNLEGMVLDRTKKLNATHAELVRISHRAGMSEIASGVLHNVGNVLNSLTIGTDTSLRLINKISPQKLSNLAKLLTDHLKSPEENPLNQDAPKYVELLAKDIDKNREELMNELIQLSGHSDHIKHIIATQQKYAATAKVTNVVEIQLVVEDALAINEELINENEIVILKEYKGETHFRTQQDKLLQILINLISNAAKAFQNVDMQGRQKEISINSYCNTHQLYLMVKDNATGISDEIKDHIFDLGVKGHENGHGIGLHLCATMVREMNGTVIAENNLDGPGTTFTIELPYMKAESKQLRAETSD